MAQESQNQSVSSSEQKEKGLTIYSVAGQEVKLSFNIVRNFLVRGNTAVSDQEVVLFISTCKYNNLNPFLGESYLVKYGTEPATMIVSKEAFFKRADACEKYEGIEAGIIVQRGDEFIDLDGTFKRPDDILVGGWAKVYRSDKRFPFVSRVNLDEYTQKKKDGTANSFWSGKPSTMICKVAKMQALREAFPSQLGAMYAQEESKIIEATFEEIKRDGAIEGAGAKLLIPEEVASFQGDASPDTPGQSQTPGTTPQKEKAPY